MSPQPMAPIVARRTDSSAVSAVDESGAIPLQLLEALTRSSHNTISRKPPSKRRKLDADQAFAAFDPVDAIVVCRSSLEIDFPQSHLAGGSSVHQRPLAVQLNSFTKAADPLRPKSLEILDRSDRVPRVLLHVPARVVRGWSSDARIAAYVSRERPDNSNAPRPGRLWLDAVFTLTSSNLGHDILKIDIVVKWSITTSFLDLPRRNVENQALDAVLAQCFPDESNTTEDKTWSPQDFYQTVHVPRKDDHIAATLKTGLLETNLFPFQQRAVQWLLGRERMRWSDKTLKAEPLTPSLKLPYSFIEVKDRDGTTCYVSHLLRIVTRDPEPFAQLEKAVKGGILAEEMGLGKTVEMIALMILHQMPSDFRPPSLPDLKPTRATLIITPPSILGQWISELNRHAPTLRVFHYEGIRSSRLTEKEYLEEMQSHDVIVTTYNVLSSEIHYAVPPPDRQLRHERRYDRPTSPLKQLLWWRVCLDEAQMIESGVSNAARVARLIPRVHAWGISGTPVKSGVNDLHGLLIFLQFEPYLSNTNIWKRLISDFKPVFRQIFGDIALRHSKQYVRDELRLPPQRRYVITVPFTAVEEQFYRGMHEEMARECGLDTQGAPLSSDWDPTDPKLLERMRRWLVSLRKCALQPGGSIFGRRNTTRKDGPLRTVEEVLQVMLEQSDTVIRQDHRTLLLSKLQRGQMLENSPRAREALEIWTGVLGEANDAVDEARQQFQTEFQAWKSQNAGKSGEKSEGSDSDDSDDEMDESPEMSRLGMLRNRLRSALEVQHMALFFQSNGYFQVKSNGEWTEPGSEQFEALEKQETEGYEHAKAVRREILSEITQKAQKLMKRLAKTVSNQGFVEIPEFPTESDVGGIQLRAPVARLDALAQAIDAQANQLDEWRERVIQLLLKPLVDEEEDAEITGEEYEESTKVQEEILVHVQALRAMVADRHDTLTGQINLRIKEEVKTSLKLAKEGAGPYPEKTIELLEARNALKPAEGMGSIRAVIAELRGLATSLKLEQETNGPTNRTNAELALVEQHRAQLQKQFSAQMKAVQGLEKELDLFTTLMNVRVEFYRQLQHVSDTVAPYEGPTTETAVEQALLKEVNLVQKLATSRSKHRYLVHLQKDTSNADEQRTCVICTSQFFIGALTVCGHQFCKDCITLWWQSHHNCPVCKRKLTKNDMHDVTYKDRELKVQTEEPAQQAERSRASKHSAIYSNINQSTLNEINNIQLDGPSYTTKTDTLIRHMLWLREKDPGAKCVVFSQYSDFLYAVGRAFSQYKIGFVSLARPQDIEKFKTDPSVECFLLHARAQSSGLNLVNASHVILCEPLINTALELQAIARVDRIGQQQATTVWLYLVDGTVEEAIYNISVKRRLEHMEASQANSKENTPEPTDLKLEAANSKEVEAALIGHLLSKRGEGERVDDGDLWECLFGSAKGKDPVRTKLIEREARRHLAAEAAEARALAN